MKLPAGRLELMTDIRTRRFWPEGTRPSEAASLAGEEALVRSGLDRAAIGALIFSSISHDMMEPATASFVHRRQHEREWNEIFDGIQTTDRKSVV